MEGLRENSFLLLQGYEAVVMGVSGQGSSVTTSPLFLLSLMLRPSQSQSETQMETGISEEDDMSYNLLYSTSLPFLLLV